MGEVGIFQLLFCFFGVRIVDMKKILTNELFLFIGGMLGIELFFRINAFGLTFGAPLFRSIFFGLALGFTLALILSFIPFKVRKWVGFFTMFLICAWAYTQLGFKTYMGNYQSLKAGADGAGRIISFAWDFIKATNPFYFLLAIFPLAYLIWGKECKLKPLGKLVGLCLGVVLLVIGLVTMDERSGEIARDPAMLEASLNDLGFYGGTICDLMRSDNAEVVIMVEEPEPEPTPEPTVEAVDYNRYIDDSAWIAAKDAEENENIKTIDEYLLSRSVTPKNDMTGLCKGYNLIYIMVEAYDYMAIDPELTPTLYKMQQEGMHFDNYYTPKYGCTTGESEFIGLASLVPRSDICTPNTYFNNAFPTSIYNQFKQEGYFTIGFHNWHDEFYERRKIYTSMGCDEYYNQDDLNIPLVKGWLSDTTMVEMALPYFTDKEPFMCTFVTSTTHFPYDASSYYGDLHLDEINQVHPDYPINIKRYISKAMELDNAMKTLLEGLEEKGILDHTMIVLYADHHPLRTEWNQIAACTTQLNRAEGMNIDRTPAFMYCASLEPMALDRVASTYDLLPTVLNLFDCDYDPRLYFGNDYFSEQENVVIFNDSNFVTDYGLYYANTGKFVGEEPYEGYVSNISAKIKNARQISKLIYTTDYYTHRDVAR